MAINLAEKYSPKVVDKFYKESVILGKSNKEYDWDGVNSIKVWTITTHAPTAYLKPSNNTSAVSLQRYGTTYEVEDTIQTMPLTQDRAVSLSVDKGNNTEQMLIKNAGKVMSLELREQFVPEFDKYALARYTGLVASGMTAPSWASLVNVKADGTATITKSNIVGAISDGVTALRNNLANIDDCYCYIGETEFANLLLSPEFINYNNPTFAGRNLERGVMGKVRGIEIVPVPDSYLTAGSGNNPFLSTNLHFIIVKKESVLVPTKIKDMKVHQDPPGLSGALLEVRWLYDAFVLNTKAKGIYVSKKTAS